MRAVVYARISDDRTGAGLGVARQEADCRALCETEGWDVTDVLVDNDRSAYRGKKRPGFERLRAGLLGGEWDVVVAWHPDRLTRHPKELESLIDLLESTKVNVRTVMSGEYDLTTASGKMSARVVGAVARHESEQKSERILRKHRELAENGHDAGGGKAYGWIDRVNLHPDEAAEVRKMAQRILDGGTLRGVVRDLEARGVRPPLAEHWNSFTVRRILIAPRTAGFREHGGKLYPGKWEPVLDELTWRRLRALLTDPGRRAAYTPRSYLLTGGLAVCGLCGAGLVARPKADGRRCYVCASPPNFKGCGKIRILADSFEAEVEGRVQVAVDAGLIPPLEADVSPLLVELEQVEARLAELADDYYASRAISKAQFQSASAALNTRQTTLRAHIGTLERVVHVSLEGWRDQPVEQKRSVVARWVESVIVNPAVRGRNRFDPDRVVVNWRA